MTDDRKIEVRDNRDRFRYEIVVDGVVAGFLQYSVRGGRIVLSHTEVPDANASRNVPPSAYVTLVADGDAKYLYAKFGFVESAPVAVNMEYVMEAGGVKSHRHLET